VKFSPRLGGGFGGLALSTLLGNTVCAGDTAPVSDLAPEAAALPRQSQGRHPTLYARRTQPRRSARPQADMAKYDGKPAPTEAADDEKITGNLLKSPYKFNKHGHSGLEFAETLPAHRGPRR